MNVFFLFLSLLHIYPHPHTYNCYFCLQNKLLDALDCNSRLSLICSKNLLPYVNFITDSIGLKFSYWWAFFSSSLLCQPRRFMIPILSLFCLTMSLWAKCLKLPWMGKAAASMVWQVYRLLVVGIGGIAYTGGTYLVLGSKMRFFPPLNAIFRIIL